MITNSSLVALHEACCAILSGNAKSAIVMASSVIPVSEDGAEKGEAVSAVYIKTLHDAIRDGNPIRAVIRASTAASIAASHDQDAAVQASEKLIRDAYAAAGLGPHSTLLVQVSKKPTVQIDNQHCTNLVDNQCDGANDNVSGLGEVSAINSVFGDNGIYLGEGAPGLVSLIKAVVTLENRLIPPTATPSKLRIIKRKLRLTH